MGLRDIPKFVSQEKKTGIFENKQTNWGMQLSMIVKLIRNEKYFSVSILKSTNL